MIHQGEPQAAKEGLVHAFSRCELITQLAPMGAFLDLAKAGIPCPLRAGGVGLITANSN